MIGELGLPIVGGGFDLEDAVFGDEAEVGHAVLGVAEEEDKEVTGARELVAHGFEAQSKKVLGMVPECFDIFVQEAVGGADLDPVSDNVIGGDSDDAPGDRVLAPGFEGVLVDLVDLGGVVVVRTAGKGGPAGRVVDADGDGGQTLTPAPPSYLGTGLPKGEG